MLTGCSSSNDADAFGGFEDQACVAVVARQTVAERVEQSVSGDCDGASAKAVEQRREQLRGHVDLGAGRRFAGRVVAVIATTAWFDVGVASDALAVAMNVHDPT